MRRVILLVVLGLSVLTGCLAGCRGDSTVGTPPTVSPGLGSALASRPARPDPGQQRYEDTIAACMAGRGFPYVPHPAVVPVDSAEARFSSAKSVLQPPAEVLAFRQKYGFGLYARLVYPNDPVLAPGSAPEADRAPNPNAAIRDALDPSRQEPYDVALHDCSRAAGVQEKEPDLRSLRTDPKVLAAAAGYAGCLRDKGHPAARTEPGEIETSLYEQATEAFGAEDLFNPDAAEQVGAGAARDGLTREINLALDDLDCRTAYAEVVAAFHATLSAPRTS